MKKLIICLLIINVSTNISISQVKTTPKFKLTDTIGTWNYGNLYRDSLKQDFIQTEIIKQFNSARIAKVITPLTTDSGLRPAAVHNAIYNRYCLANQIEQYAGSGTTMTHFQYVDIPNFEEIPELGARIKLLDQNKYQMITEEITFNAICACNPETFQQAVNHVVDNFKASSTHWNSITNVTWDAVYVFYDLHATELFMWTNPFTGQYESFKGMNVMIYVILGKYK
jgi:hypothetical protein